MPHELPRPLRSALLDVADALATVPWLVAGSTARALCGFDAVPRDLDIEVASSSTDRAAELLGMEASDRVDPRARSRRATGTIDGVEVDLTAGLTLIGPGGVLPPDFDLMQQFATTVTIDGRPVPVAPVEEQIVRILVGGDETRRVRLVAEAPAGFTPRGDYVELRLAAARAAR
jgi:hypothetical protein